MYSKKGDKKKARGEETNKENKIYTLPSNVSIYCFLDTLFGHMPFCFELSCMTLLPSIAFVWPLRAGGDSRSDYNSSSTSSSSSSSSSRSSSSGGGGG